MSSVKNPIKSTDKELFQLIENKIKYSKYFFTWHAKERLAGRTIIDLDVLRILEGTKENVDETNKKMNMTKSMVLGNTALKAVMRMLKKSELFFRSKKISSSL